MRNKHFIRGAALALVSLMTLSSVAMVHADETETYSSLIDPTREASLHIVDLISNDGTSVEGTGLAGQTYTGNPVSGTVFSYLRIAEFSQQITDETGLLYYTSLQDDFAGLLTDSSITMEPSLTEGASSYYTPEQFNSMLAALEAEHGQAVSAFMKEKGTAMPATDTEGKTEAEGLPQGLYLVAQTDVSSADTGSASTLIADGCHPFLISLPMTNQATLDGHEAGSVWQYDVWAYPKNSTVGITKNLVAENDTLIESDDFNIGDSIRQVITTDVPVMQGDRAFEKFAVTDTMEEGLTFLADSLKVSLGDDAFSEENVVLTKDTDYVLSQDDSSFTVTLTENGLSKLNGLTAPSKLFVTFEARLNGAATIGIDTNDNTPKLSIKEKNSSDIEVGGNTPRSATYEMNISKEFVSLTEPDYSKVSFEMTDGAGETILWTLEESGIYHPHYAAEEGEGSSLIIPDADGRIMLRGLDEGDYVLTEITTVPGQNLLAESIRVHLEGNDPVDGALKSASIQNGQEEAVTLTNEDELNLGIASFSIVNNRAVSLLRTGGTGSRWLYAIGGILLLGGAVAAWKGRKWLTLTAF